MAETTSIKPAQNFISQDFHQTSSVRAAFEFFPNTMQTRQKRNPPQRGWKIVQSSPNHRRHHFPSSSHHLHLFVPFCCCCWPNDDVEPRDDPRPAGMAAATQVPFRDGTKLTRKKIYAPNWSSLRFFLLCDDRLSSILTTRTKGPLLEK